MTRRFAATLHRLSKAAPQRELTGKVRNMDVIPMQLGLAM